MSQTPTQDSPSTIIARLWSSAIVRLIGLLVIGFLMWQAMAMGMLTTTSFIVAGMLLLPRAHASESLDQELSKGIESGAEIIGNALKHLGLKQTQAPKTKQENNKPQADAPSRRIPDAPLVVLSGQN